MVEVLQAVVILAVATSVPEVERILRAMRRSSDRAPERGGEQTSGAVPVTERRPAGGAV
jgi:hypothetical protein